MDRTNTLNEQLYIVSLDNGIRREEPISLNVLNSFKDGSQLVQLNNSVLGVYKSNTINEQSHLDDYEIIKTDIAELLDIDHEEAKRIVTEESNVGVFTLLNYSKNIETRISATTVLNHIIEYINKATETINKASGYYARGTEYGLRNRVYDVNIYEPGGALLSIPGDVIYESAKYGGMVKLLVGR
jgi:hypothetical protein